MPELRAARVGLVTDDNLNRYTLQKVLSDGDYELAASLDSSSLAAYFDQRSLSPGSAELDVWLIDTAGAAIQSALELLADKSELPLLLNDHIPATNELEQHELWRRRLLDKLELVAVGRGLEHTQPNAVTTDEQPGAEKVWLLVASLGGPEAVKRFIDALPGELPIAMVYGQHIESNFDGLLASALGTKKHYPIQLVSGAKTLIEGQVYVVPVDHQLRFLSRGRVVETRKAWIGCYQPCLDQVIADLARVYRERLGVIVFSGMCNDGEIGCRVARANGATVWAQTPDSCLSPDMPNAAIGTGCVSQQGSPEQLAAALVSYLRTGVEGIATLSPRG